MKSEWLGRLKHLENTLIRDFYHPLGSLRFSGFVTNKNLSLKEAALLPQSPINTGDVWGKEWHYAWVFATIEAPAEVKGERLIMNLNLGGEATLFLNGSTFGTRRGDVVYKKHQYYMDQVLTPCAEGGESYQLACEVYAGHPMPMSPLGACATGPIFPEEEATAVSLSPACMGENSYGIWNEEAYQLWLDVLMLREIMQESDPNSFRVEDIEYGLQKLLVELDMEQPLPARRRAYVAARELIAPLMAAKNGSSAPQVYAIANSHLDMAWLWDLDVTRRKTARTFAAQLRLLDEYEEMKFIHSQPVSYEMCREHYPDLFEKIKQKVRSGQWIADGAMWIEPDTNLSSGESLVRQFLYGKRYFKEVFGVDSKLCWLPDTFGYSAVLPQILKSCQVDYLTTQKIYWTYNDSQKFPHHAFCWEGMDGSKINSYVHREYESMVNPAAVMKHWNNRMRRDGTGKFLMPFGYGDGGCGPTRDDMEQIRRSEDLEGTPKISYTTPYDFMKDLEETSSVFDNCYTGELYFACHRGTYTTQASTKRDNRKTEIALHEAELWSSISNWQHTAPYQAEKIEVAWKKVLLNQFHDILPGSSIAKVYEDAAAHYKEVFASCDELISEAQAGIVQDSESLTLFNGTSFAREGLVSLPPAFAHGAQYLDGESIPCAAYGEEVLATLRIPAYGHVSISPAQVEAAATAVSLHALEGGAYRLENEKIIVQVECDGTLSSVQLKSSGASFLNERGNQFRLFRDVPRMFDAWDIDSMTEQCEVDLSDSCISVTPHLQSALKVSLKLERDILNSKLVQYISLSAGAHCVDFETSVDWKELHKLLKVSFATGVQCTEGRNQIQFGFIKRPTHRSNDFDADRFEVCNHFYTALCDEGRGAALINESKYGIGMLGDELSLTLLKAGGHPEFRSDNHMHHFSYSYSVWEDTWMDCSLLQDAYHYNYPVLRQAGSAPTLSYFELSKNHVVLESVKLAEDGSGDMILRLYEAKQAACKCELRCALDLNAVIPCDMLENKIGETLKMTDKSVHLSFRPFEIKTLRLKR